MKPEPAKHELHNEWGTMPVFMCVASSALTWQLSGSPGQSRWLSLFLKQVFWLDFSFQASPLCSVRMCSAAHAIVCCQWEEVWIWCPHINITSAAAAIRHSDLKQKTERGGGLAVVYGKRLIDMWVADAECLVFTLTNVSEDDDWCKQYGPLCTGCLAATQRLCPCGSWITAESQNSKRRARTEPTFT